MKKLVLIALLIVSAGANSDDYVKGYIKKDGTYVQGHYKTQKNNTDMDNYSTKGNYNPHTGQYGTKIPQNGGYGSGSNTSNYNNGYYNQQNQSSY